MHFWIDKRSQAYIYSGRPRVVASLGANSGVLRLNQTRRIPRASKSMVTPIHRFPTVECTRSHIYRQHQHQQQQQQQSPSNLSQQSSSSHSQQNHFSFGLSSSNQLASNNSQQAHNNYSLHRIYNTQQNNSSVEIDSGGTSGTNRMISAITSRPSIAIAASSSHESQLLPTHLKFGVWASLALATIFVTSAKFYFDHQGTGLEVLLFCAFSATFFLVACTVSLWKRPNHSREQNAYNAHTIQTQTEQISTVEQPMPNNYDAITVAQVHQQSVAPPPPYHIAILLPENSKDVLDETPPPSYDKIII